MKGLWLRLYTEILDDPKVQKLPPDIFKTWINLLCVAKNLDMDGVLPEVEDLSFLLRIPENTVIQHLKELCQRGLLDENEIHGWKERQFISDNDPTAVDRKRRQRHGHVTRDVTHDVTDDVTDMSRVTENNMSQNVTRTETETETETENTQERVRETAIVMTTNPPDENFQALRAAFQSKNLLWPNPAKEIQAIRQLCALASQTGDAPETLHRLTEEFWRRKNGRDAFWSRQPFVPSRMLALWNDLQAGQAQDLAKLDPAFDEVLK